MSVFIDTSAILAIFDSVDPRNKSASATWTELMNSDDEVITSNYVIVETTALLHSRFGIAIARQFADNMVPVFSIEWVDEQLHNTAVSVLNAASSNRSPSLVDCVSFEVIRQHKVDRVFAYDRHFEERVYEVIG
ncbi:PIN domain-containing protein [bacterium]|nr:PIN domain-containing protein [bacterium]